jgi:hypothetical protein
MDTSEAGKENDLLFFLRLAFPNVKSKFHPPMLT